MKSYVVLTRKTFLLLLAGCLLASLYTVRFVNAVAAKENAVSDQYRYLKTFTDVLALVQKNYVEEVNFEQMIDGAIKGMLLTLDPHSGYLTPELYKELQVETKGEFGGLGIEITIKNNLLTVVAPIEDSPAFKAGVQPGDQIIKIEDEFTRDLSLIEAVNKMRGPKGSPITISVHREDKKDLIPITIVRDIIKVKSVRSRMLDDGFGYLRIAQFQEGTEEEAVKAMKELTEESSSKELHGLVLDVRNDPGGLLAQAIKVSDLFLKEGIIVYTDGRLESQKDTHNARDDGNEPDYPIVVLVNGGSASASEIVAGALQDAGRALVLGVQTFGKGSVQTILPMDNGGALRLTTALYYTRSGRSIQAKGVTPDVIVPAGRYPRDTEEILEEEEIGGAKEKDLPGSFENPEQKKNKGAEAREKQEEHLSIGSRQAMEAELSKLLRDDPQLDEALRLLKTWKVFQGRPPVQAQQDSDKPKA